MKIGSSKEGKCHTLPRPIRFLLPISYQMGAYTAKTVEFLETVSTFDYSICGDDYEDLQTVHNYAAQHRMDHKGLSNLESVHEIHWPLK